MNVLFNIYETFPDKQKMEEFNYDNYDYIAQTYEFSIFTKDLKTNKNIRHNLSASMAFFIDFYETKFQLTFDIVTPEESTVIESKTELKKNPFSNKNKILFFDNNKEKIKIPLKQSIPFDFNLSIEQNFGNFLNLFNSNSREKIINFLRKNSIFFDEKELNTELDILQQNMTSHFSEKNFVLVTNENLIKEFYTQQLELSLKKSNINIPNKHKI